MDCVWRRNESCGRLELTGPEGDVVRGRPLTAKERQGKLFPIGGGPKKKASGGDEGGGPAGN